MSSSFAAIILMIFAIQAIEPRPEAIVSRVKRLDWAVGKMVITVTATEHAVITVVFPKMYILHLRDIRWLFLGC